MKISLLRAITLFAECRKKYILFGKMKLKIPCLYLQPIITQYFIDNKSEIWLLFLIAHSKR